MESLLRAKRRSATLRDRVLPGGGTYSCSLKVNEKGIKSGVCLHVMACLNLIQSRACNIRWEQTRGATLFNACISIAKKLTPDTRKLGVIQQTFPTNVSFAEFLSNVVFFRSTTTACTWKCLKHVWNIKVT